MSTFCMRKYDMRHADVVPAHMIASRGSRLQKEERISLSQGKSGWMTKNYMD